MSAFEKFKQISKEPIPLVGERLGEGTQGEVFSLLDDPNKVIKFAYLESKKDKCTGKNEVIKSSFLSVMGYLKKHYFSCFPKVYHYGVLDIYNDKSYSGNVHLSFSVVEKLEKLSEDEAFMIESIVSHIENCCSDLERIEFIIRRHCDNYNINLNIKKFMRFYTQLICVPVIHNDMCGSNFMIDEYGDYKLIDFDRARLSFL